MEKKIDIPIDIKQKCVIQFYVQLGKSVKETCSAIRKIYGVQPWLTFEWWYHFKDGKTDMCVLDKHDTLRIIHKYAEYIMADNKEITLMRLADTLGLTYLRTFEVCHNILRKNKDNKKLIQFAAELTNMRNIYRNTVKHVNKWGDYQFQNKTLSVVEYIDITSDDIDTEDYVVKDEIETIEIKDENCDVKCFIDLTIDPATDVTIKNIDDNIEKNNNEIILIE